MTDRILCWLLGHDWSLGFHKTRAYVDGGTVEFLTDIWIDCHRCKMRKK